MLWLMLMLLLMLMLTLTSSSAQVGLHAESGADGTQRQRCRGVQWDGSGGVGRVRLCGEAPEAAGECARVSASPQR